MDAEASLSLPEELTNTWDRILTNNVSDFVIDTFDLDMDCLL